MKEIWSDILDTFENEDIKEFAEKCIDTIPPYFYKVGASSTGKYHPKYALGELGLARHTLALCRILNNVFEIDCWRDDFSSRQRDLLRVAGIMHDSRKSGDQEQFESSKYTKHEHPLLAVEVVRTVDGLSDDEIEYITDAISSHMGQWNASTHSKTILPVPKTEAQKILHLCDYLASRKYINILFDDNYYKEETRSLDDYKVPFGKYKGMTIPEIAKKDAGYYRWMKDTIDRNPVKLLIEEYEKQKDENKTENKKSKMDKAKTNKTKTSNDKSDVKSGKTEKNISEEEIDIDDLF